MNYYNEFDPAAAAQLQALMDAGLTPKGHIDTRSITDVKPHELKGYTQCHFFAGIGGWSLALQLAGWPADRPVWTGSCPCQPFSVAGKGRGSDDERHLWPAFFGLIRVCRPDTVFGEQVESAIRHGWLDGIRRDVEGENYALGDVVLGAHSIGAPHLRQRLFWVAHRLGAGLEGLPRHGGDRDESRRVYSTTAGPAPASGSTGPMADVQRHPGSEHEHEPWFSARRKEAPADGTTRRGDHGGLGHTGRERSKLRGEPGVLELASGEEQSEAQERERSRDAAGGPSPDSCGLGDAESDNERRRRQLCEGSGRPCPSGGSGDGCSGLGDGDSNGREPGLDASSSARHGRPAEPDGFWSDSIWIRCVDGKHRRIPAQSDFFTVFDGVSDALGCDHDERLGKTFEAINRHAAKDNSSAGEVLRTLRQIVFETAVQGANGGCDEVQATEVLLFILCQLTRDTKFGVRFSAQDQREIQERDLQFLWRRFRANPTCPPQRRELAESRPDEPRNVVLPVSHGEASTETSTVLCSGVYGYIQRKGFMWEALSEIQEIWGPVSDASQNKSVGAILRSRARIDAFSGFPLADRRAFAVGRKSCWKEMLKGAGNAIVPQVAAEFIKAYDSP